MGQACTGPNLIMDEIEPIDPTSNAYREAALHFNLVVLKIDDFIAGCRDARMASVAISFALGLNSTRGRTITSVAAELGVTKQAVSRYVCRFLRLSGLEPAWGLKTTAAKQTYARTNGHKRVDVDDMDDPEPGAVTVVVTSESPELI